MTIVMIARAGGLGVTCILSVDAALRVPFGAGVRN